MRTNERFLRDSLDDLDSDGVVDELRRHGIDVNYLPRSSLEPLAGDAVEQREHDAFEMVPMEGGWLRLEVDDSGMMIGRWTNDPSRPDLLRDEPPIVFDEANADDLSDWVRARMDLDVTCQRWVQVLRLPHRETYQAVIYEPGPLGPVRRRIITRIYPDVTLCGSVTPHVAYVELVPGSPDRARARLAPVDDPNEDLSRTLVEGPAGGVKILPCGLRRFVKVGHGVRSTRIWELVDVARQSPQPTPIPGAPSEPELFDVAQLGQQPVLVQARNRESHWSLLTSVINEGEVRHGWESATGPGKVLGLAAGDGYALLRVRTTGTEDLVTEHILRVPLTGFSTAAKESLASSSGLFNIGQNTCAKAVGFSALELNGGMQPFSWLWDKQGRSLNLRPATNESSSVRRARDRVNSDDGYVFDLDLRWRGPAEQRFCGPVIVMVYGAYGNDVDLDTDPDLGRWLDRGFAVATPHVRGGGDAHRHRAGYRANRERSIADTVASLLWLRGGMGTVTAESLTVIGASAGGFLAAAALATRLVTVEAAVIVNGFIDPLSALLRANSLTLEADQDEWGDPHGNLDDRSALTRMSPLLTLEKPRGAVLVIVAGRDIRVDPRQGLRWYLRYRALGGSASLWFDPNGTHDRWGSGMEPDSMISWVVEALAK